MIERVLFAGGGTGGHVYMAVALGKELEEQGTGTEILFVGTERGIEKNILPALGFHLRTINIGGLKGMGPLKTALSLLRIPGSLLASHRIIQEFHPSILVGLGGYSSGPVMLAGKMLGLPLLLIEPNVYPGLTNRILRRYVDGAAINFEETAGWFGEKARLTGIPVRTEFQRIRPEISCEGPLRLLIFGGSQGSRAINRLVCQALPFLSAGEISIVHQTGPADHSSVRETYEKRGFKAEVMDFIQDMPGRFERAHLILSRAGALTVAEITAAGRPAILVPLPHAADDHQRKNARALAEKKAVLVLEETETSGRELAELLVQLSRERSRLQQMATASKQLGQPAGREKILQFMEELVARKKSRV